MDVSIFGNHVSDSATAGSGGGTLKTGVASAVMGVSGLAGSITSGGTGITDGSGTAGNDGRTSGSGLFSSGIGADFAANQSGAPVDSGAGTGGGVGSGDDGGADC